MPDVRVPPTPNPNSFATVAEANDYHATRLRSDAWATDTAEQETALIQASRILNMLFVRAGAPVVLREELVVPQNLKEATAEFARQLIEAERTADNATARQGLTQVTAGPVTLKFRDDMVVSEVDVLPDAVKLLLLPEWYLVPVSWLDIKAL